MLVQVLGNLGADWADGTLTIPLSVPTRGGRRVEVGVCPVVDGRAHRPAPGTFTAGPPTATATRGLGEEPPQLETPNVAVQRTWDTAVAGLVSLPSV